MNGQLRKWLIHHQRPLLVLILVSAVAYRLAILFGLRASIYRDYLFTDERGYHVWAKDLAAGVPRYWCHISPLPAYYVAAIYRLFGVDSLYVRYANLVLGVATCWVLFGIGRRLGGALVGLLCALVAATCRPFVFLSITALKEPLVLLTFSLMVFFFLGELKQHRHWQTFCLGLTLGCIGVLRPNAGVALLIVAPMVVWRARGRKRSTRSAVLAAAVLVSGVLIPSAPFMLKNYLVAGQLSPAPQGGIEFYVGNSNRGIRPYYTPAPFATPSPEEQGIDFRIEASRRTGYPLTFAQASSYWTRQVINQAREAPWAFAERMGRKVLAALNARDESDNQSIEFLSSFIPILQLQLVSFWLVMPFGIAGLVCAMRRHRGALPLALFVLAYGATLVLLYCNLRLRVPVLVVLIPFASDGLLNFMRGCQGQRSGRVAFVATAVVFGLIEFIPLAGAGDLSGHYNTHAALLLEKGNERGALAYWHKSQRLKGAFSDFATLSTSQFALARGNTAAAEAMVRTISDDSFAVAFKYDFLGDVLAQDNRPLQATAAYEKALSINSGRRDTRQKLISIYERIDADRASRHQQVLAYIETFFAQR